MSKKPVVKETPTAPTKACITCAFVGEWNGQPKCNMVLPPQYEDMMHIRKRLVSPVYVCDLWKEKI